MNGFARKWIRRGTAALILVLIAVVAVLAAQRIRQLQRPVAGLDPGEVGVEGDDPVQGIYTGFKYVETVAGQLVFILDSVQTLGKTSGWHEIEGVRLQLYNEGDEGPVLTCEAARFNIETRDSELRGPINVEFPGGAILNTGSGRFEAASRRIVADSTVLFTNGDSVGQAGGAVYSLEEDRLDLLRNPIMRSAQGVTMRAPRITYHRDHRRIEFEEGCTIEHNGSRVVASRATLEVSENEGAVEGFVFSGGVTARSYSDPERGVMEGWADRVTGEIDPEGNWQLEASTPGPWITIQMQGGEDFYHRTVQALSVRGVIAADQVLNMRAEGGVCLRDVPASGDPRRGQAESARLWFENGEPTDVELSEDVVLNGNGIEATGHQARVSAAAGVTMLNGDPFGPERAILTHDRGRISCDQVHIFDQEDRTEARGDVQGFLEQVVLLGTEAEAETSPLNFASGALNVTNGGDTFHLRNNARLWQGNRLLLADEVVYHHSTEMLEASGHVRTTIPAVELDLEAQAGDDVVVEARSLDFDRGQQQASYIGNVSYNDPNHTLSANELIIFFDEENTIIAVEAVGAVELVDLAGGRRMTGSKARREVMSQTVHVTGSPVQLSDEDGTVISSSSLTWDQASGSVTLAGGTETIYYPEDTP
jgi:lipopolysaccharide export system protein LptA